MIVLTVIHNMLVICGEQTAGTLGKLEGARTV